MNVMEETIKAVINSVPQSVPRWMRYQESTRNLIVEIKDMMKECDAYEEAYNIPQPHHDRGCGGSNNHAPDYTTTTTTTTTGELAFVDDGVPMENEALRRDGFYYCPYQCGKEKRYDPDFPHIPHVRRNRIRTYLGEIEKSLSDIIDDDK